MNAPLHPSALARTAAAVGASLLRVDRLTVRFGTAAHPLHAVEGASFDVTEVLCLWLFWD